jgi:hypothetical protein
MALNQTLTLELRAHYRGKEMLAIALNVNVGTSNTLLDVTLNLLWGWQHYDLLISMFNILIQLNR